MSTRVEKRVLVNVPVSVAYNQWTQFEEFPHFMGGVKSVKQLSDDQLEWVAEIGGVRRKWQARILEQVPDQRVAWAATEGATNAGSVTFEDLGGGQTSVQLSLEYEPEGIMEKVGDKLNIVEKQAESDLNRFKAFIEDEGYATGAWRGSVSAGASAGTPGLDEAAGSRGDSGKAGVSGTVIAGVGLAAVAAAGVAAAAGNKDSERDAAPNGTPYPEAEAVPPTRTSGGVFPGEELPRDTHRPANGTVGRSEAKPFDQTNGLVDTEGDSDGTAVGDTTSAADRATGRQRGPGQVPPAGGSLGQH
ncbi:SRPBCC family protein [Arthrobacter sp. NPDC056886]|uniref:SRPBCC family protein n=1 Tax=Arthrobacter sp. NPDC056886 TaxID=3345960 RepID=UPI00366AE8F2